MLLLQQLLAATTLSPQQLLAASTLLPQQLLADTTLTFTKSSDMLNETPRVQKGNAIKTSSYLTITSYIAICNQNIDINRKQRIS